MRFDKVSELKIPPNVAQANRERYAAHQKLDTFIPCWSWL